MSSVHIFKSSELHFIRILHNLQAVPDSHGDIPPLWRAVSASLLISEKSWQADGSEQRGQLGSLSQPHSFTQSQSQRTPAVGAFIFLHKKDRQHSKDSLCLHGASQTMRRGKWTACPHCKTGFFYRLQCWWEGFGWKFMLANPLKHLTSFFWPQTGPKNMKGRISSTPAQPRGSVQPWAGEKDPADGHRLMSQDYKRLCMLVLTVLLQPASDESKEGKHSLFPHNEVIHQWKREFTPLLFRWLEYPFEDRINSIRAINVNAEQQIL